MPRSTGRGRPVDRINTTPAPDDTERAPLLAATPTPITPSASDETTAAGRNHSPDHDDNPNPNTADGPAKQPAPPSSALLREALRPRVLLLTFALLFLLELAIGTMAAPTNAIMESIICRQMHPRLFRLPDGAAEGGPVVSVSGGPGVVPAAVAAAAAAAAAVATAVATGDPDGWNGTRGARHFAGGVALSDDPVCKAPDVQGHLAMLRGWQATFDSVPGMLTAVPYGVLSDRWGRRGVLGLGLAGVWLGMAWLYAVFYFSDVVPLWTMWFGAVFQL
ncbi:hypothetical protein BT67DRAFT_262663 [Trichocladium antarcticum]|uniref:Major facilitator superfamily (MFS) profile domain-containing protein n=1 Tax=Trichocladium antarcticum TaxID=1450529 RepID=A0AAN6UQ39_9PEZI|nr:hypothetical protein BT67DRAFT_262663 [Trichocladium antarcticum]